jgi:hypothetical protein
MPWMARQGSTEKVSCLDAYSVALQARPSLVRRRCPTTGVLSGSVPGSGGPRFRGDDGGGCGDDGGGCGDDGGGCGDGGGGGGDRSGGGDDIPPTRHPRLDRGSPCLGAQVVDPRPSVVTGKCQIGIDAHGAYRAVIQLLLHRYRRQCIYLAMLRCCLDVSLA